MASQNQGINIVDTRFIISADLGQANDYTAISIIQREITGYGVLGFDRNGERLFKLGHIERMRGKEYTEVVDRLKQIYHSDFMKGYEKAVCIDYTGLGRPVADLMKKEGFLYSLNAINITGGNDSRTIHGHFNVPKRELISNLSIALQTNELKIPNGLKEAKTLLRELQNFQTKISDSGHDHYDAKVGEHDDLVLSVAMGVWLASRRNMVRTGDDKLM